MLMVEGTVVEVSMPQHRNYQTREPEFWPGGNPKLDVKLMILMDDGEEIGWQFQPRKSNAAEACIKALDPDNTGIALSYKMFLGKRIRVATQEGQWGNRNPRPWVVQILGDGDKDKVRGAIEPEDTRRYNQQVQQQQAQVQQANPLPQQQADILRQQQQRAAQAMGFQQPMQPQQPMYQQPPVQQYAPQPQQQWIDGTPQYMQQPMAGGPYAGDDIPF